MMFNPKITEGTWLWTYSPYWEARMSLEASTFGESNKNVCSPDCCNDGDEGAAWFSEESLSNEDAKAIAAVPELLEVYKAALKLTKEGLSSPTAVMDLFNSINKLEKRHGG